MLAIINNASSVSLQPLIMLLHMLAIVNSASLELLQPLIMLLRWQQSLMMLLRYASWTQWRLYDDLGKAINKCYMQCLMKPPWTPSPSCFFLPSTISLWQYLTYANGYFFWRIIIFSLSVRLAQRAKIQIPWKEKVNNSYASFLLTTTIQCFLFGFLTRNIICGLSLN